MASTLQTMGIGSGLDIPTIINSLMNSESAPLNALQNKAAGIQTQISTYGQVSSAYSQLKSAIDGLRSASTTNSLLGLNAGSTSAGVANASITGSAGVGAYALNITTMAKGEQIVTTGGQVDSSAAISTMDSTITLQLGQITGGVLSGTPGTYSGSSFAANGTAVPIAIKSGATLSDIRDAINSSGTGVSATLINDGTKYRLSLSSTSTGIKSSISISATGDPAISSLLSQDPAGVQGFQETQAAADLAGTLNGIAITSSSNSLDKSVSGLAITVYGTGAATINVNQNPGASASALGSFVTAWNGLNGLIKSLSGYDATTKTGGPLLGDPLAGQALNGMIGATFSHASTHPLVAKFNTLASIGLTIDSTGAASIDQSKLSAAMKSDPNIVANLFSTTKGDILKSASTFVDTMAGKSGIAGRTSSLSDMLSANQKQQEAWNNRLTLIRKNLTAQYTALDASVAKMQSTSSFLTNQIAQLNKSTA